MADSTNRRGLRPGCVIGIVSLAILLALATLARPQLASCRIGPGGSCITPENPLGLADILVAILFVLAAIGTVGSALQVIWRFGKGVARLFRRA